MKLAGTIGLVSAIAATAILASTIPANAGDAKDAKAVGPITAIVGQPTDDGKVLMIVAGQAKPITAAFSQDTQFAGICLDCQLMLTCKSCELGKPCTVCGCGVSNTECLVGKKSKTGTWQELVKLLPRGSVLRPTFNDPDKPESGVKKVLVDRRSVLLPVDGLSGQSSDQIAALVKPVGGTKAELLADGKQLSITLKDDWTAERETKLEKAIVGAGGKLVVPSLPSKDAAAAK